MMCDGRVVEIESAIDREFRLRRLDRRQLAFESLIFAESIAVQQRDAPLVKILLQAGADPDRTDAVAGYSARDYAIRDARAREILKMIEAKKPKKASTAAN